MQQSLIDPPWHSLALTPRSVRVGVTGHRFLAETDLLAAGIERCLDRIRAAFSTEQFVLLSALAEGADRLVASHVLARLSWQLVAVLPLALDDYLADFPSQASQAEFSLLLAQAAAVVTLPTQPERMLAYAAGGIYILDHCDVMLAIWDGQGAQGQGGTGEIVTEARRRDVPLAWVHAGNRHPGANEPTSLGAEQGLVTYERFPA